MKIYDTDNVETSFKMGFFTCIWRTLGTLLVSRYMYKLALWIRDILVRIRIRGSVQLTYGSGSFFFVSGWQHANKNKFLFRFLLLITFEGTFTSFFKRNGRMQIRFRTNNDGSGSERPRNIRILRIWIHNTGINKQVIRSVVHFSICESYSINPNRTFAWLRYWSTFTKM